MVLIYMFFSPVLLFSEEIKLTPEENGNITVTADGKPFTTFILNSHNKPVLYPLIGPTGFAMTRQYPLEDALPSEKKDHPHQRSCWFAHGDINGLSYWHQEDSQPKKTIPAGHILLQKIVKCEGNTIIAESNWVNTHGEIDMYETRTMEFYANETARWIDFTFVLTSAENSVRFGDTKEGLFGIRVAGVLKTDAKMGGRIINSAGQTNAEAWGKPARWVDYNNCELQTLISGGRNPDVPSSDEKENSTVSPPSVGVAILNHPESYAFPSCYHVRGYGLFAANPFGLRDFYGENSGKDGSSVLKKGESFTFKYRLLLHIGDEKQGQVEQSWKEYSQQ